MATARIICSKNDGKISVDVDGVKGEKCVDITKFLEPLGTIKTQKTGEFYEHGQDNDVLINTQTT
jgi:hypothetical protein